MSDRCRPVSSDSDSNVHLISNVSGISKLPPPLQSSSDGAHILRHGPLLHPQGAKSCPPLQTAPEKHRTKIVLSHDSLSHAGIAAVSRPTWPSLGSRETKGNEKQKKKSAQNST